MLITEVDISNTNIIRKMVFFIKVYKKEYIIVHVNVDTTEVYGLFFLNFNIDIQRMILIQCHLFGFSIKLHNIFMQSVKRKNILYFNVQFKNTCLNTMRPKFIIF